MTKRGRFRIRRILKWAGVAMCVLTFAVWVLSLRGTTYYYLHGAGGFGWSHGYMTVMWGQRPGQLPLGPGWRHRPQPAYQPITDPDVFPWPPLGRMGNEVFVACWLVLSISTLFTICAWWAHRRRIPPGHCKKCGYNLTGNVSGICPECGTKR